MGGLVSRAYLEGQGYTERRDIDHLITFGTPHRGVASDVLLRLIAAFNPASIVGGFLPCATSPGTCELSYEAMTAFNRGHSPRQGVVYDLVAGDKAIYPFSWFIPGADDGLVEASSAAGLPVAGWRVHDSHTALGGLAGDHYMQSDESRRCLERFLGLGSRQAACAPFASGAQAATTVDPVTLGAGDVSRAEDDVMRAEPGGGRSGYPWSRFDPDAVRSLGGGAAPPASPAGLPQTPIETGALDPGATWTLALALDGSPGVVVVGWGGEQGEARLRLADGREVAPDARTAGPALFRLPRGGAGPATLALHNHGAEATAFAAFAVLVSPISLAAELHPGPGHPASPGGRAGVTARLVDGASGLPGASVEATYQLGGRVRRVGLTDRGDGVYQGELSLPDQPGLVHVVVRARGIAGAGAAFERAAGRVVIVGDGAAMVGRDD